MQRFILKCSRRGACRVSCIVGRILVFALLFTAGAWAQSLDGARVDLHVDGDTQRYRLVAEPPPGAQTQHAAGELRFTWASPSAPATVHVHAMEIPLPAGQTPLNVQYEWDFGDPLGRGNTLSGFNAAHVYDRPGQYTVSLRITDPGGAPARTFAAQVNILPDQRRAVYVDASSLDAAVQLLTDDTRLLLKRGETYLITRTLNLAADNLLIGAYGEGDDPKLVWAGRNSGVLLATAPESRDVLIEHLTFDAIDPDSRPMAIRPQGRNLTIRNCTFAKVDYAINGNARPRGLFAIDNVAPQRDSIRSYFAWVAGEDHVYLSNRVANSLAAHVVRMNHFNRVLVAKNDFANRTFGGVTVQQGSFAYVTGNTTRDCEISAGPLGGADGIKQDPTAGAARTSWVVIEDNTVINDGIGIRHGAQHVMLRDNQVLRNANTSISVGGWDATYGRGVEDIWIVNNRATNIAATGRFLKIEGNPLNNATPQVTLTGNTYVAPNLQPGGSSTAIIYVVGDDLRGFREISNNLWPKVKPLSYAQDGVHYVWPKWSDARGYRTPDEWRALGARDDRYENVPANNE